MSFSRAALSFLTTNRRFPAYDSPNLRLFRLPTSLVASRSDSASLSAMRRVRLADKDA